MCVLLRYETWFLVDPGCVSIQFRKDVRIPKKIFEILNKKKTQKIDYLAMPETYGNIHICKKASKAVNKLTPINRWGGGGKQATLGLWETNGPKFPPGSASDYK